MDESPGEFGFDEVYVCWFLLPKPEVEFQVYQVRVRVYV
jgi:hypothetical protein